jgi:hypothetical protein
MYVEASCGHDRGDTDDPPIAKMPETFRCPTAPMKLVKTIAYVPGLPELFVFYCSRCKQAETKVQEKAAA